MLTLESGDYLGIDLGDVGIWDNSSLEVFGVVVSPAVNGFSGDAGGFGDLGIGLSGEDVGDGKHLLFLEHFFERGFIACRLLGVLFGVPVELSSV